MGFLPRLTYRFAIPLVVFLLIVVTIILPLGRSAYNSLLGDKVTVEYKARVVSMDGGIATIQWNEDQMVIVTQGGDTYVPQSQEIELKKYKNVKIGDTFTIAVTEPGLLKRTGLEVPRTVEVKKHNINFFKSTWRKLFG